MIAASFWTLDSLKILTRRELAAVLAGPAPRSAGARMNRVIFRLACCCGLRVSEIAALRLADVCLEGARPHLRIRPEGAKGHRARRVPLWWDAGTLADLKAWKAERRRQGARLQDAFVCCLKPGSFGQPLHRHSLRRRFLTASGTRLQSSASLMPCWRTSSAIRLPDLPSSIRFQRSLPLRFASAVVPKRSARTGSFTPMTQVRPLRSSLWPTRHRMWAEDVGGPSTPKWWNS